MSSTTLHLKGFSFQALLTVEGLTQLDHAFLDYLKKRDTESYLQLQQYRQAAASMQATEISQLLITCAPILEDFLAELFNIETAVSQLRAKTLADDAIFAFKKHFVLREARRRLTQAIDTDFATIDQWLFQQVPHHPDRERAVAEYAQALLDDPEQNEILIEKMVQWCVLALRTHEGQQAVQGWVSFQLPKKLNYENLVEVKAAPDKAVGCWEQASESLRQRDGFALTDARMTAREAQNTIHYCVYCHDKAGDFCSKGFPVKKNQPELGLKINPLGDTLTGCPLDEKISEMHWLKKQGFGLAALAVIMVDNPMCPATGHRICNDCMKACIYQKQEPVNIPQAETRILFDALQLPWGVELYDLLTRWNPLRSEQYLPKPYNGLKIFVMGMGPAGFSMAHHLLMEGFAVVGADGLKLEPLNPAFFTHPIHDYNALVELLDARVMGGFGGVAEYGITARWDKNFLKLIYISLLRRPYFQIFGSVRFGGTLMVEDAWKLGFDHLVLAVGAGLPRELRIKNSLAPGMRQANDFLMSLQLSGAAKRSSLANLQVQLPAVVIGGGLTGVDTATEVQAYYVTQVEKILWRYETLVDAYGTEEIQARFDPETLRSLETYLAHGHLIREERTRAHQEQRPPHFIQLIRAWGGVTIVYRRTMQESPAYRRNYEELTKALEEGIYYAEGLEPESVALDPLGAVSALVCRSRVLDEAGNWMLSDEQLTLAARSIFVATGAQPNVAYHYEHRGTFQRDGSSYASFQWEAGRILPDDQGVFTSYERDHHRVSFIGDTHPRFHGSVVKAIASAQYAYPKLLESLRHKIGRGDLQAYAKFRAEMDYRFCSKVMSVKRHTPQLVELVVQSPMAAQNFRPGQFYRLQNYESLAATVQDTCLQIEALAALAVPHRTAPDCLSFMIAERGVSSRLIATLKTGMPFSVMGPTGASNKTLREPGQAVLIIGAELAIAYLLSAGPALRTAGHRVLFVGLFEHPSHIYCQEAVYAACDQAIWLTQQTVDAIPAALATAQQVPVHTISQVIIIGSARLIRSIRNCQALQEQLAPNAQYSASVYGPMQCMLKGVCAQCLQWQIDPETGQRKKAVYACSWQHQPLEKIDIEHIDDRLGQNRCQETLSSLWLDYLLTQSSIERV